VHDHRLRRVTLYVLEDRGLAFLADLDIQDTRVERLVIELLDNAVVVERDCPRRTSGTVNDCGYFPFVTQAAARTFPLVLTDFRNQIEFVTHDCTPYLIDFVEILSTINPAAAATSRRRGAHGNRSRMGTPASRKDEDKEDKGQLTYLWFGDKLTVPYLQLSLIFIWGAS
jgi:hypothetical protein